MILYRGRVLFSWHAAEFIERRLALILASHGSAFTLTLICQTLVTRSPLLKNATEQA